MLLEDGKEKGEKQMAVRNNEDRRVRKTKKQLRTALTSLLLKKDLEHITVRDVAELADVNRGTFYAHYRDVEGLLTSLEEELYAALAALGEKYKDRVSNEDAFAYLTELFELAGENADLVYALRSTTVDMDFQHRLNAELERQYLLPLLQTYIGGETEPGLALSYVTAGLVAVALKWIEGGKKESTETMARLCGNIITRGVGAV